MEKNMDLFGGRSEVERMKNVANMVHDIVNPKSTEPEEVPAEVQAETTDTEGSETTTEPVSDPVNPVVDLVAKTVSSHKPRGMFMHMVNNDEKPKS